MSVSSRSLVELVLLGPSNDRRQLQDSPILGDVWIAFALNPSKPMDLLITPYKERPAGPVAVEIAKKIGQMKMPREDGQAAQVAYLQGLVAARLFFEEVLRVIVPMTKWWHERNVQDGLKEYRKDNQLRLKQRVMSVIDWAHAESEDERVKLAQSFADFSALDRYVVLTGIILWAARRKTKAASKKTKAASKKTKAALSSVAVGDALAEIDKPDEIVRMLHELFEDISGSEASEKAQIWQVSLNRKALPALEMSVPAVKGDAARTLFNVRCDAIKWAVLDSGIDGTHPAFKDKNGESRIIQSFDFGNIREIVSLDNLDTGTPEFKDRLSRLRAGMKNPLNAKEATGILVQLAEDAENDRPIHWELVEKFIEIDPATPPRGGHGTHVAGIIGANAGRENQTADDSSTSVDGMCPDIKFYDFRVLAKSLEDTEFAIIAALQYLRYMNERHTYTSIHGANLSLSIPHDVRNYACGRTPICNECARLVESGVVVVAAAGNLGYQRFETQDGSYEGYTAFSITDPGNADSVITVGATHRYRPHTYGVSFFSSRGPTGDGRLKPDLVAPGERIQSCVPGGGWGELDGTSMAAPHVSGAAAMLMARYTELIGEPRRIKNILCESATDLNRERSFQGYGMLDVLRAFQKI
jgi:hypothetical protein